MFKINKTYLIFRIFFLFLMPAIGFLENYLIRYGAPKTEVEIEEDLDWLDELDQWDSYLWLLVIKGEAHKIPVWPPIPPLLK